MSDNEESELKGIAGAEHLTLVDRLRGKMHPTMDRNDAGQVTYPRKEYLENQAQMRRIQSEQEKRKKNGG